MHVVNVKLNFFVVQMKVCRRLVYRIWDKEQGVIFNSIIALFAKGILYTVKTMDSFEIFKT